MSILWNSISQFGSSVYNKYNKLTNFTGDDWKNVEAPAYSITPDFTAVHKKIHYTLRRSLKYGNHFISSLVARNAGNGGNILWETGFTLTTPPTTQNAYSTWPLGLHILPNGNPVVGYNLNSTSFELTTLDTSGNFASSVVVQGTNMGTFTIDAVGNIYSYSSNRVRKSSPSGILIWEVIIDRVMLLGNILSVGDHQSIYVAGLSTSLAISGGELQTIIKLDANTGNKIWSHEYVAVDPATGVSYTAVRNRIQRLGYDKSLQRIIAIGVTGDGTPGTLNTYDLTFTIFDASGTRLSSTRTFDVKNGVAHLRDATWMGITNDQKAIIGSYRTEPGFVNTTLPILEYDLNTTGIVNAITPSGTIPSATPLVDVNDVNEIYITRNPVSNGNDVETVKLHNLSAISFPRHGYSYITPPTLTVWNPPDSTVLSVAQNPTPNTTAAPRPSTITLTHTIPIETLTII